MPRSPVNMTTSAEMPTHIVWRDLVAQTRHPCKVRFCGVNTRKPLRGACFSNFFACRPAPGPAPECESVYYGEIWAPIRDRIGVANRAAPRTSFRGFRREAKHPRPAGGTLRPTSVPAIICRVSHGSAASHKSGHSARRRHERLVSA